VTDRVRTLFDEFAARRARGEQPDVDAFLERAGDAAPELGRLIDALLTATPVPEPSAEQIATMAAWLEGEPALLALRTQRRARRAEVVNRLMVLLGLPARARERVAENYHRLETGLIDASRIDRRLRDALGEVLGARLEDLPLWPPPPPQVEALLPRIAGPLAAGEPRDQTFELAEPPDPALTEVDRLFGIG